ncbi:MAG: zinc ribbon domain-containing protein, partial [Betaproteobacteria bacterium]
MIKYCSHCGASVSFEVPPGDALPRHICKSCGHIQYQNPR